MDGTTENIEVEKRNFNKIWQKGKRDKDKTKSISRKIGHKSRCSPYLYWYD